MTAKDENKRHFKRKGISKSTLKGILITISIAMVIFIVYIFQMNVNIDTQITIKVYARYLAMALSIIGVTCILYSLTGVLFQEKPKYKLEYFWEWKNDKKIKVSKKVPIKDETLKYKITIRCFITAILVSLCIFWYLESRKPKVIRMKEDVLYIKPMEE